MQTNLLWIWEDYTVVWCHLTFHAWLVGHHVFCLGWEDARERERRAITLFSNTSIGGKQGWTMGWSDGVWQQGMKVQLVNAGQTPPMRTNCSAVPAWSPGSERCRTQGLNLKTQRVAPSLGLPQLSESDGWICDTLTLLLHQMLWSHLHILLADTHIFA